MKTGEVVRGYPQGKQGVHARNEAVLLPFSRLPAPKAGALTRLRYAPSVRGQTPTASSIPANRRFVKLITATLADDSDVVVRAFLNYSKVKKPSGRKMEYYGERLMIPGVQLTQLVGMRRVELPRDYSHLALNQARLPFRHIPTV